jgi:hypothetical protein
MVRLLESQFHVIVYKRTTFWFSKKFPFKIHNACTRLDGPTNTGGWAVVLPLAARFLEFYYNREQQNCHQKAVAMKHLPVRLLPVATIRCVEALKSRCGPNRSYV